MVILPLELKEAGVLVNQVGATTMLKWEGGGKLTDADGFILLRLSGAYRGRVCGLCGNFNEDPGDDLLLPDGQQANDPKPFTEAWARPEAGQACRSHCGERCGSCSGDAYEGPRACGLLELPDGPFAACHAHVAPAQFAQRCVEELCSTAGHPSSLCRGLHAYAVVCRGVSAPLGPWRNSTFCPADCLPHSRPGEGAELGWAQTLLLPVPDLELTYFRRTLKWTHAQHTEVGPFTHGHQGHARSHEIQTLRRTPDAHAHTHTRTEGQTDAQLNRHFWTHQQRDTHLPTSLLRKLAVGPCVLDRPSLTAVPCPPPALNCAPGTLSTRCLRPQETFCASAVFPSWIPTECFEGCECPGGTLAEAGLCVPSSTCGCIHQGRYLQIGEEIVNGDCTERCRCTKDSNLQCERHHCEPGVLCGLRAGARGCLVPEASCTVGRRGSQLTTFTGTQVALSSGAFQLAARCHGNTTTWFRLVSKVKPCEKEAIPLLIAYVFVPEGLVVMQHGRGIWVSSPTPT
ncbi:IgGFc-binding protein-like [Ornithorhynchus anatinus]|uniref:IgGFc-binding protein-like n=1 Tax=Ornithorhynchus anatinus TaxID=9258 RepID=UPI0019D4CA38|nr:IgGFc-binding protein-like [Ornithorhynchus anatinus]